MITVRLPDELRDRIDAVRGDVPRERWVRRALEAALSEAKGSPPGERAGLGPVGSSEPVRPAASPRAHEDPRVERQRRLNEQKYGRKDAG